MMFHGLQSASPCPDKPWTDTARPSWLPCFIDTPTESSNKLLYDAGLYYANPPAPVTIAPPNMATDPTGVGVSIDQQITDQTVVQSAANAAWSSQQGALNPPVSASLPGALNDIASLLPNTSFMQQYGPYIVLGVGGLIVFTMVANKKGKR
jgi:hypothetical protein